MKSLNRAGLLGLVFGGALAATVSGCDTSLAQQNFGPPTITNIYALDTAVPQGAYTTLLLTNPAPNGLGASTNNIFSPSQLPDVMMYSDNPAEQTSKVSPFPPVYGSLRIELSQTIDPTGVASANSLSSNTFCPPVGTPVFILKDAAAGNAPVPASVCYDPASDLGQHPKVFLTLGSAGAFDPAAQPFTCQLFSPEDLSGGTSGTNLIPQALKADHQYTLTVTSSAIKSSTGVTFQPATGGSPGAGTWSGDNFNFKTSDFRVMAVGYQDPGTGFFVWLDKPFAGFEKDLAAVGSSGFEMPTDDTPLMVVTTEALNWDSSPTGSNGSLPPNGVTAVRAKDNAGQPCTAVTQAGCDFGALVSNDIAQFNFNTDPRVVFIGPAGQAQGTGLSSSGTGGRWEPSQNFTLILGCGTPALAGCNPATVGLQACDAIKPADLTCATPGQTVPVADQKTYTFKSATGTARVTGASIGTVNTANGAVAAPLFDSRVTGAVGTVSQIQFSLPVDPTTVDTTHFKITPQGSGTAVPATVAIYNPNGLGANTDNQVVRLKTSEILKPATVYNIGVTGVKTVKVGDVAAQPVGDFTATFTTATFRVASVTRACHDFPFNAECANAAFAPFQTRVSVDRGANQPLSLLKNNNLRVAFTNSTTAATVTATDANGVPTNLIFAEDGQTQSIKYTIADGGLTPANSSFLIYLDAAYAVKCNQRYNIIAKTTIKDANGVSVTAEGCNPATAPNGDCSDLHFFTTEPFAPQAANSGRAQIGVSYSTPAPPTAPATVPEAPPSGMTCSHTQPCFSIRFNAPIAASTVDPALATCTGTTPATCPIKLSETGQTANIGLNCPPLGTDTHTTIWCNATQPMKLNTSYTVGEVFTTPIKIAPTIPVMMRDLVTPASAAPPPTTTPADQTSCSYTGSATRTFRTPCT